MSPATESLSVTQPDSALVRALHWSVGGLHWWRRAPLVLPMLCVMQMLVEGLLQLIPWGGMALSKLLVPLLGMGILLGLDEVARGGRLRPGVLLACLRRPRVLSAFGLAAMYGFSVFGFQQLRINIINEKCISV